MIPTRPTFALVPPAAEVLLYVVFAPFAIAFVVGLYLRLRPLPFARLLREAPGGLRGALLRFGWAGLAQGRVARRRRGWPHVAIFYGFLTLLAGTTIVAIDWDIARPLGTRVLAGARYLYFEALLDALGLMFALGVATAIVWRLIRWPRTGRDQRRMQWQFIALLAGLLFMGLTGFALEALRLTLRPVAWAGWSFVGHAASRLLANVDQASAAKTYVALWWAHTIVAFTLIASLPYSAFLHSLGAPLNLLIHSGRPKLALDAPFDLRELEATGNFDVKVGAATLADLQASQQLALLACTNCGRCDDVCPALAAGTALSPRRLVQTLRGHLMMRATSVDLLDTGAIAADALWACTTCAACVEACPVFIRPVDFIVPFRRELMTRQRIDSRQTELLGNVARAANPYGLAPARRADLARTLPQQPT